MWLEQQKITIVAGAKKYGMHSSNIEYFVSTLLSTIFAPIFITTRL